MTTSPAVAALRDQAAALAAAAEDAAHLAEAERAVCDALNRELQDRIGRYRALQAEAARLWAEAGQLQRDARDVARLERTAA